MIRLFCGYDAREAVGFHTFVQSVIHRASAPVSITPLASMGLPVGSNTFTLSRFLVPYLMDYKGHAIFADASDMLMHGDVAELDSLFDPQYSVQVVKHPDYQTRHPKKYMGTEMECVNQDYSRKNWASLMILNCSHPDWRTVDPKSALPLDLLQLKHCSSIGDLPNEWNRLVDEGQPTEGAKIMHWTAGIPAFDHYKDAPGGNPWRFEFGRITG
jgi:hypothetical protein